MHHVEKRPHRWYWLGDDKVPRTICYTKFGEHHCQNTVILETETTFKDQLFHSGRCSKCETYFSISDEVLNQIFKEQLLAKQLKKKGELK